MSAAAKCCNDNLLFLRLLSGQIDVSASELFFEEATA
jgi:hypothetical protein